MRTFDKMGTNSEKLQHRQRPLILEHRTTPLLAFQLV